MLEAKEEQAVLVDAIQAAKLPDLVENTKFEFDTDSVGDPSVLIYVIVGDSAAKRQDFHARASKIRESLREAIHRSGLNRWPYIRFRTQSEEKALESEGQD